MRSKLRVGNSRIVGFASIVVGTLLLGASVVAAAPSSTPSSAVAEGGSSGTTSSGGSSGTSSSGGSSGTRALSTSLTTGGRPPISMLPLPAMRLSSRRAERR